MLRAPSVAPAGSWKGEPADTVTLDHDERHRRRIAMKGLRGLEFLLDLPEAVTLRHGDALKLEDGRLVEVVAAPEDLVELRSADAGAMTRLAWHLGNRHTPTELTRRALRIRRDPVLEDLAKKFGAQVIEIHAPFNPEGGAYVSAPEHDHKHRNHDHDHVHDENCGHDHGHDGHDHDDAHHEHHDHDYSPGGAKPRG
jgi:urease accessory protein